MNKTNDKTGEAASRMEDLLKALNNSIPVTAIMAPSIGSVLMAFNVMLEAMFDEELVPSQVSSGMIKLIELLNPEYSSPKLEITKALLMILEMKENA